MSWGTSGKIRNGELQLTGSEPTLLNDEMREQYDASLKAVEEIFESGALGGPEKTYAFSISGHGNKDHEPVPGWANDGVYISISQLTEEV